MIFVLNEIKIMRITANKDVGGCWLYCGETEQIPLVWVHWQGEQQVIVRDIPSPDLPAFQREKFRVGFRQRGNYRPQGSQGHRNLYFPFRSPKWWTVAHLYSSIRCCALRHAWRSIVLSTPILQDTLLRINGMSSKAMQAGQECPRGYNKADGWIRKKGRPDHSTKECRNSSSQHGTLLW